MATFNKFNQFVQDLGSKVHNLGSDSLKLYITNTAPSATNAVKADLGTELATTNCNYTTGGIAVPATVSYTLTGNTSKLATNGAAPVVTATGTTGSFRYVVLFNDTPTSPLKPLIGWWDYGSSISLNNGETFTISLDPTNGILQIS